MKYVEKIKWLPVSERFNQYLCSYVFKFFRKTCPLYFNDIYRQSGQNQVNTRFETKTSFKKHMFWSKEFIESDANSLEQFVDGPEVVANSLNFKHKFKDNFFKKHGTKYLIYATLET